MPICSKCLRHLPNGTYCPTCNPPGNVKLCKACGTRPETPGHNGYCRSCFLENIHPSQYDAHPQHNPQQTKCPDGPQGKSSVKFNCPDIPAIICDSLHGKRGDAAKRIADTFIDNLESVLQKNADYGCSVWERPMLAPRLDAGTAILVRMTDKIKRLQTLLSGGPMQVKDESIEDTIRDLGNYCGLYLARPQPSSQEKGNG